MRTNLIAFAVLLVSWGFVFAPSSEASIVYDSDIVVGNISITGTITTDGNLGRLLASDLTSVSLIMHTNVGNFTLDKASELILANDFGLTATPTELDWTYANSLFSAQLFLSSSDGLHFIAFSNGLPLVGTGENVTVIPILDVKLVSKEASAVTVLGVADPPDPPAPEPATFVTMLGGASMFGFVARRRWFTR